MTRCYISNNIDINTMSAIWRQPQGIAYILQGVFITILPMQLHVNILE